MYMKDNRTGRYRSDQYTCNKHLLVVIESIAYGTGRYRMALYIRKNNRTGVIEDPYVHEGKCTSLVVIESTVCPNIAPLVVIDPTIYTYTGRYR